MSLECYKHVLNVPNFVFKTPCNMPLSCRFTSQKVTNVSLMRQSSTRPVIYLCRAILRRKYSVITPVLWCYTPEIHAFLRRKCAANASQIARFLSVFRPQFARTHAYLTSQARPLYAAKAPKTHPFNAANISLPERRPKTPVFRS